MGILEAFIGTKAKNRLNSTEYGFCTCLCDRYSKSFLVQLICLSFKLWSILFFLEFIMYNKMKMIAISQSTGTGIPEFRIPMKNKREGMIIGTSIG